MTEYIDNRSNITKQRINYFSVVDPSVTLTTNMNNNEVWGTIKISAQPFDIRTCDINNIFVFSGKNLDKKINWGKAILYNYVGIKLEKAKSEGEYNANSDVEWEDITENCIFSQLQPKDISPLLKEGKSYKIENYVDLVAAHNLLYSNYINVANNAQYHNFDYALNYNKYMDVTTGASNYDVDDIITRIRNNDVVVQEEYYNYGTPTSVIDNLDITLNYRIQHILTSTPQTYKLTVGNPSNVVTPYTAFIYHKANSQYYTYVDDTKENNENGEILLYYDINNADQNKIKINLSELGKFQNVKSRVKLVMKKNVVVTQTRRN